MNNTKFVKYAKAKCVGAVNALEKLSNETKPYIMREGIGLDYNSLRNQIIATFSEVGPLLPPEVRFERFDDGNRVTITPAEFYNYYSQLLQIILTIEDDLSANN